MPKHKTIVRAIRRVLFDRERIALDETDSMFVWAGEQINKLRPSVEKDGLAAWHARVENVLRTKRIARVA